MKEVKDKQIVVIPATKRSLRGSSQLQEQESLRVAAYCRVSTDDESQQTSYANQKAFYTSLIQKKSGWSFAGIYADEALSGTSRVNRTEFNRMLEDALNGRLDYIVTKSISRFARNTMDTLSCVRQLRQLNPPVGIYFEKENIDTLDAAGELVLTILSALAQDESRSISDNIRWTFAKKFAAGIPVINLKRMLGYDRGEDGEWYINPEQAEIVRYIFEKYFCGLSANRIAANLNEMGKRTVNNKLWRADGVLTILRNEKYAGDLEMQKTVTESFLTHRSVRNDGQAPKYYIQNHHTAIIDRNTWNMVRMRLKSHVAEEENGNKKKAGPSSHPFIKLHCGFCRNGEECKKGMVRITYTRAAKGYTDERCLLEEGKRKEHFQGKYSFAYPVWRCQGAFIRKRKERENLEENDFELCGSRCLYEIAVEQSFMELIYYLKRDYESRREESDIVRLFEKSKDRCLEKNFEHFLQCLKMLPEKNSAGMPLIINEGDEGVLQGEITKAPDLLIFERGIFEEFIIDGVVYGDLIRYSTNFGVYLVSRGNERTLDSFIGWRKCSWKAGEGDVAEVLKYTWQVSGAKVQYRKKG